MVCRTSKLLSVSSDGHVGPQTERYRDYMDPEYRVEFELWFTEYVPMWLTK